MGTAVGYHGVPGGLIIVIEDREVAGYGPCNPFGAGWSQDDGASDLVSGAIGCEPTVARQEDEFFRLLLTATTVDVDDDEPRLTGEDGALVFSRLE
jgi:heat shock protein HslJ